MPGSEQAKRFVEHRAHPRVPMAIPAKISIPAEAAIRECVVTDLSAGGAGLQYIDAPPRAELVCLLTVEGFGSFEGITIRDSGAVRGVRFLFGEAERRHLQENLIAFIKEGMLAVSERPKCERGPEKTRLAFTRTNGDHHQCEVRDISLRGVSLETQVRPPVGELVKLARVYGRVVHHDTAGIGIEFVSFVSDPAAAGAAMAQPAV
jgi:hypothetical protein